MEKSLFQVQSSKDGVSWSSFNAGNEYNVVDDIELAVALYRQALEFHSKQYTDYVYHRIVHYEVFCNILKQEKQEKQEKQGGE